MIPETPEGRALLAYLTAGSVDQVQRDNLAGRIRRIEHEAYRVAPSPDAPGLREAALLELLYHATTRRHEFTETCASCSAIRAALAAPSPDAPGLREAAEAYLAAYDANVQNPTMRRAAKRVEALAVLRAALAAQSEETPRG